jgi:hypothetical protein
MTVMDLVAGDPREIVLTLAVDDESALEDATRFEAHLSLGSGLDPTWLDEFSRAVRAATGGDAPKDFLDAREELPDVPTERVVERVDPEWVAAVAAVPDRVVASVAADWIERMAAEGDEVGSEEKEELLHLATRLVAFARTARDAETDVVFAWSL